MLIEFAMAAIVIITIVIILRNLLRKNRKKLADTASKFETEISNGNIYLFPKEKYDVPEEKEYYDSIRYLAVNTNNNYEITMTSSPWNERKVLNCIFATSTEIYIFEKNLNSELYEGTFLIALEEFFKRQCKLKILLQDLPEKKSKALMLVEKYNQHKQKCILISDKKTMDEEKEFEKACQKKWENSVNPEIRPFIFGNNSSIFIREENENSEISFHSLEKSGKLNSLFRRLAKNAKEYEPQEINNVNAKPRSLF